MDMTDALRYFGALAIVKVNAQWFHVRERGTLGAAEVATFLGFAISK